MGRSKQTFLQRRHIDAQGAHEKMLKVINYQRNANQNYNEVSPNTDGLSEWPSWKKNLQIISAREGVEKKELPTDVAGK